MNTNKPFQVCKDDFGIFGWHITSHNLLADQHRGRELLKACEDVESLIVSNKKKL